MNPPQGPVVPPYPLAPKLDLCQVLLSPTHLKVLVSVIEEKSTRSRLAYLREAVFWSVILDIAMGVSRQDKAILVESVFRSGHPCVLVDYFSDADLLKSHYEIAHTLYWTLHPRRIKTPWILPAVVMRFFRPSTEGRITVTDRLNMIKRILVCISPGLQPEVYSMAVALYNDSAATLNKRYEVKENAEALKKWAARKAWDIPDDSHWNLSRVWWISCQAYVDAMLATYDIRLDFSHHSVYHRYPGREVVAVLALGHRVVYDAVAPARGGHHNDDDDDDGQGELGGQSAMDHCIQWMTGTDYADHTNTLLAKKCPALYGDVLRVLFFGRLHIQAQWDAAASRGLPSWAEGSSQCGYLVYIEKK